MRQDALRRYLIYRMKLLELLHLHLLWQDLSTGHVPINQLGHEAIDFANSIRTASLSWFVTIVDQSKGGMNVFDLWRLLFPRFRQRVDSVWAQIEPQWKYLREFRDKVGFHADTPLNFFRARAGIDDHVEEIAKALQTFLALATELMRKEDTELPDFVPEVEVCLLDLECLLNASLDRSFFKRALILPRGNYRTKFP